MEIKSKNTIKTDDIESVIVIPKGATNGDVICTLYPKLRYTITNGRIITTIGDAASFDLDWWNSPYRKK